MKFIYQFVTMFALGLIVLAGCKHTEPVSTVSSEVSPKRPSLARFEGTFIMLSDGVPFAGSEESYKVVGNTLVVTFKFQPDKPKIIKLGKESTNYSFDEDLKSVAFTGASYKHESTTELLDDGRLQVTTISFRSKLHVASWKKFRVRRETYTMATADRLNFKRVEETLREDGSWRKEVVDSQYQRVD